jgi:3-oxoacyl-[acyl-carrier-protein] synthase II
VAEKSSGGKKGLLKKGMTISLSKRRVMITGYGMITPLGKNTDETFENASQGKSGIDYITSFDTRNLPCQIGGEIDNTWLPAAKDESRQRFYQYSSRGLRLMRAAAREAAQKSRLDEIKDRDNIGVSLGTHGDNPRVKDIQFIHRFYDGNGKWDINGLRKTGAYPFFDFFRRKPDAATSILSAVFNCKGPVLSIASACAAGSQAIGEAYKIIQQGKCDVMIAGGCEATLDFIGLTGFILLRALSEKYSTPQKASRPFEKKRNGFVMSEGAGALILEELEHARSRRTPILGELFGFGSSADAFRITDMHPKGTGAAYAIKAALEDASLTPDDIDYINAHGTSTAQNDISETRAIKEVFGKRAMELPVSSNKSMLGHTIAAAGAIECILSLEGIKRSVILPTINYEVRDPRCDLDYVPNEARHIPHQKVLSNSFGFGGQNACLCIGAYKET